MAPSVRDVLAFHRVDRAAYDRLLSLGERPQLARTAVALLMWLDHMGVDAVAHVLHSVRTTAAAAHLVAEAHAVLYAIQHGAPAGASAPAEAPLVSSKCGEPAVDHRFLAFNREAVLRGVAGVLDGVGALVFDDYLHSLLRRHEAGATASGALPPELAVPYRLASPSAPEDSRSLFVTFSKGSPLTREEITDYFTEYVHTSMFDRTSARVQEVGECVERVMMEKTAAGLMPKYGRVVFWSASVAGLVLNGERLVKLVVNGRQLWARKYVPRIHTDQRVH